MLSTIGCFLSLVNVSQFVSLSFMFIIAVKNSQGLGWMTPHLISSAAFFQLLMQENTGIIFLTGRQSSWCNNNRKVSG